MIAAQKTEGPAENTHVIARSEATWQSRGSRNIPENRRDCHALRARNDVVTWWPVLLFCSGGHGGTARGPFPTVRIGLPELPGCRSGGFTRLLSSNIHQSRVCQRPLAAKQKDHPGGGWSFYPIPTRGAGTDWKRHSQSGTVNLTPHIIAKSRSFDNLWKVKLTLDFFRYVWKKKPEFATKW